MITLLLKATVAVMLGLGATWLLPRARASVRHLVLAATFVSLLALPLASALVPAVDIEVDVAPLGRTLDAPSPSRPAAVAQATPVTGAAAGGTSGVRFSRTTVAGGMWAAGVALLLASFGIALWRLSRLKRRGMPALGMRALVGELSAAAGIQRSVDVMFHEQLGAPLTCGVWQPAILLPSDARSWSEDDVRRALVHELEHVRRGDWTVQLLGRAVCAVYWFHPLVWMAWRRLCLEAERACDDAVIQTTREQATANIDYAEQLVALAERTKAHAMQPVLAMASRSDLSRRVSALLDASQRRGRAGMVAAAAVIAMTSAFVLGIGPVRPVRAAALNATAAMDDAGNEQRRLLPPRLIARSDRSLYRAAERGDIDRMSELIAAGANVNATIHGDGSPLIAAARSGNIDAVRLLLDRGADPNLAVDGDGNPLIMAAREGHLAIVELLLDRGARIDEIVSSDENALIQASEQGELEVVKYLVGRGANVNAGSWAENFRNEREWRTPLSQARKERHDVVVAYLMSAGARE